jgi:hypothetical protein
LVQAVLETFPGATITAVRERFAATGDGENTADDDAEAGETEGDEAEAGEDNSEEDRT